MNVWSNVNVRGSEKLLKFFEFYESVVENDMFFHLEFSCKPFQTQTVGLTLLADKVRMSRSQDDIKRHPGIPARPAEEPELRAQFLFREKTDRK